MKMPYTEALLSSIPKLADHSHTRLATIPGRPPDLVNPPPGCKFAPRCAYVQDRCIEEEPPLQLASPGHEYRCWFPVGTPEGSRRSSATSARGSSPRPRSPRRSDDLMAGSGTAHLRPEGQALLRVEHLVVEFPVGAPASR